jgi:mannose-6-phosphate isomerase
LTSDEICAHLRDELLPLWAERGVDRERGGFFSQLGPDLEPAGEPIKRLLVQTRQVHVFSRAWAAGAGDWARPAAEQGVEFLLERFWDTARGGWYTSTTQTGEPLDRHRDTYGHAFALLALASFYAASGDREVLARADETLDHLNRHLRDERHGGFLEGAASDWAPQRGPRRQNPHMHLFEALLALLEVTGDARYRTLADELLTLLRAHFIDRSTGALREHFGEDWLPAPDPDGSVVEPGHHFEWAWLLGEYARLTADESVRSDADALFRFASEYGVDPEHGGVYDEIDAGGRVRSSTKRLWPQTEYLRALAARADWSELERVLSHCFEVYVDPSHRGWREQASREGRITSTDMNATSVYHVAGALEAAAAALQAAPAALR